MKSDAHPSCTAMNHFPTPRDLEIAEDLREMLVHDRRLTHCLVEVEVRGGVAHLFGHTRSSEQREILRTLVARTRGVNAVWDRVLAPGEPPLRTVDIGCGNRKQWPEAIGLDRHRHEAVDLVADATRGLPFPDGSIDHVFAVHFLEHVHDLIGLMNEIHRVLKPGGVLHALVPNWQFVNAVADPTHVRFFHAQTFKFFCRPYPGMREYRPCAISADTDNLFADLQPIKHGEAGNSEALLSRFFD